MPELKSQSVQSILEQAKSNDEAVEMMDNLAQRKCGHCAACCTWLGIQELKQFQGQTCEHLKNGDPNKRCGIYDMRPAQCSDYLCLWRIGLFPDDYRPDQIGMLVSGFPPTEEGGPVIFVINLFDRAKAGQLLPGSKLHDLIQRIMSSGEDYDVRIHDVRAKEIINLVGGEIWEGRVLKNDRGDYHGLKFTRERNIGRYETKQIS